MKSKIRSCSNFNRRCATLFFGDFRFLAKLLDYISSGKRTCDSFVNNQANYYIIIQLANMYKQRLMKQAMEVGKHKDPHFLLIFDEKDILNWLAYIHGPDNSPYSQGIFEVKIVLTQQYPIIAPKMYFKTRIFHPNIHFQTGQVCLDIIKNDWIPTWTLEGLCRATRYLLENPNADSPLNCDCGNLLRSGDDEAYKAMARMYTQQYALDKQEFYKRMNKKQQSL